MTGTRIEVRRESPEDWERAEAVVREAFGQPEEARLVARLRSVEGVLSLVATLDELFVGHTMFSPVTANGESREIAGYGLAPVSVAVDWQKRGIGSQLIRVGLDELRRMGAGLVVVLGHPSYYARFGFVAAAPLGLTCKWGGEDSSFQVLELARGAVDAYRGTVGYSEVFDETAW